MKLRSLLGTALFLLSTTCFSAGFQLAEQYPYPHLALGTYQSSLSKVQSDHFFQQAKSKGLLANLPDDKDRFFQYVQPVVMNVPGVGEQVFLISQKEAKYSDFRVGGLVRFSPHRGEVDKPPANDGLALAFWQDFGCVAVLCNPDDANCQQRYAKGLFDFQSGKQLDPKSMSVKPDGIQIDPMTLLPKH